MIRIAFLGAGRMASAMVKGLLRKKMAHPDELGCTSAKDGTGQALANSTGIHYVQDCQELISNAEALVLACKPQQLQSIDPVIKEASADRLVVSILAGIRLSRLCLICPQARNIVRAMPNTPGQIGAGVSAFAVKEALSGKDNDLVESILGSLGEIVALPEEQLDAVTGLSGSGPAYVFEFIAALRDGGIAAGLDAAVAYRLAVQTVLGSVRLLVAEDKSPEALRDVVTSPGGTTFEGLRVMENKGFRKTMVDAILRAKQRSVELSQEP